MLDHFAGEYHVSAGSNFMLCSFLALVLWGHSFPVLFWGPSSFSCPLHAGVLCLLSLSFFFFILGVPCSLWDISSLTRDQTHDPCGGNAEGFH